MLLAAYATWTMGEILEKKHEEERGVVKTTGRYLGSRFAGKDGGQTIKPESILGVEVSMMMLVDWAERRKP